MKPIAASLFRTRLLLAGLIATLPALLPAAPISTLYSTGVDDGGKLLAAQASDPHYRLIQVPDPTDATAPGLETNAPAYTLKAGFPVGPWIAEGPNSRWIAPQADQSGGNVPGSYIYRTKFDLTGLDPATAQVSGRWTSDNGGFDILLNGASLGISQGGDFAGFYSFEITSGFVAGENTLDFVVSNAGDAINPTGLRVEIVRAIAEKPGDPPRFLSQPTGLLALVGDAVTLSVEVDGTRPIAVQWRRNGAEVPGGTEASLVIPAIALAQAGDYTVVISNAYGTQTSSPATVRVLEVVPGVFATGVNASGNALDDYETDPHFKLVVNPQGPAQDAFVHDSTVFPIVAGPWVANNERSKWISPEGETSASAAGDYVYRLSFTLPAEFDPATAVLFGRWATDNEGLDIVLNGASTGLRNTAQFAALTYFEIPQGVVAGVNLVEFKVNNASAGYTALRLDPLRLGALKGAGCKLRIATQPADTTAFAGATVKLTVVADGCPPLRYQWQHNGTDLPGRTEATLELANVTGSQSGTYTVLVTDTTGSLSSSPARLVVLEPIPGLFNTGVDATGKPLEDGAVDPHYRLTTNPQDPSSQDAMVEDSTAWPIVDGPWLANSETSKWIGPGLSATAAAGDYVYRATFTIPADFDLATVRVTGQWTSDNNATDILVNGTGTGIINTGAFGALSAFTIATGFRTGENTLAFAISNPGTEANPTGLRIEGIRADGAKGVAPAPALSVTRTPDGVRLAWPTASSGFQPYATPSLATPAWAPVNAPVKVEGTENYVLVVPAKATEFFRLQR